MYTKYSSEEIKITQMLLDSLASGYCIYSHQAQRKQFQRVIVAVDDTHMVHRAYIV